MPSPQRVGCCADLRHRHLLHAVVMTTRAAPGALRATRAAGERSTYHLGTALERVKPKLLYGGSKNGDHWHSQGRGHMHQTRVVAEQQMALLQEGCRVHQ